MRWRSDVAIGDADKVMRFKFFLTVLVLDAVGTENDAKNSTFIADCFTVLAVISQVQI